MQKTKFKIENKNAKCAFTLVEILIAVSIFAIVTTIVSGLYIDAFRETRSANLQNQVYSDARFVMDRIADEIRNGMIDYDEYYNQNVVIPSLDAGVGISGAVDWHTYGQNYGRYYSSFYNTGSDDELGFDCNDGGARSRRDTTCIPKRSTIDRNTGSNPFDGKYSGASSEQENAFCGVFSYSADPGITRPTAHGICLGGFPNATAAHEQEKLYLISADGNQKTILARERIGGTDAAPIYALSILRLQGSDTNDDGVADSFVCADEFNCIGEHANLPRDDDADLGAADAGDNTSDAFGKDFVPISPLRVNVKELKFYITPFENPDYAFAENDQKKQPRVVVVMTVEPNIEQIGIRESFSPITIERDISTGTLTPIPAPLLIEN